MNVEELLIRRIGLLATPTGTAAVRGNAMRELQLLVGAAVHVKDGMIEGVYNDDMLPEGLAERCKIIDADGQMMTPGLVDAHTHMVFGGWRERDVERRLQGESYRAILASGGGILEAVRQTRLTSEQELYDKSCNFIREMLSRGVTSCEIKSGYGLDAETELKQLRVARAMDADTEMDVRTTYLGAHFLPLEFAGRQNDYVEFIVRRAIPTVAASGLADFCDVFCDPMAFDIEQSRRILSKGIECGMRGKLHADETEPMGGAALAGELGLISADSLIASDIDTLEQMAKGTTVSVLLPQTSFYLDKPYARARRMMDIGLPIALATDFNPVSSPGNNLQLCMNLGFIKYRMLPEEILTAVTLNAACAIGMGERIGTIEPGKQADFVLWNTGELSMLCYRMGTSLIHAVYKKGVQVDRRQQLRR